MQRLISGLALLSMLVVFDACCEPCAKGFVGEYFLLDGSDDWLAFAEEEVRLFEDQNGRQAVFTYDPIQGGANELEANCDFDDNCGACCDEYRANFRFTSLSGDNNAFRFDFTLQKDFIQHTIEEPTEDIEDYLSITFNNTITCELFFLPDTVLSQQTTIHGIEYSNLAICESSDNNLDPNSPAPKVFYFNKQEGIVGFELANGTVWRLR